MGASMLAWMAASASMKVAAYCAGGHILRQGDIVAWGDFRCEY